MFCKKCGKEISDNDTKCPHCLNNISDKETSTDGYILLNKKKVYTVVIIFVALVVLAVAIAVSFTLGKKSSEKTNQITTNTTEITSTATTAKTTVNNTTNKESTVEASTAIATARTTTRATTFHSYTAKSVVSNSASAITPNTVVGTYRMSYLDNGSTVSETLTFSSDGSVLHQCNINDYDGHGEWSINDSNVSFTLFYEGADHVLSETATIVDGGLMWGSSFLKRIDY